MKADPTSDEARIESQQRLLDLLSSVAWESTLQELMKYTVRLLRNRDWRSVWGGSLPAGKEAHDIVMESVVNVIEGTRQVRDGSEPIAFLKGIIRSKVNHLADGLENRRTQRLENATNPEEDDDDVPDTGQIDAAQETLIQEQETANARLFDLLIADLSDDLSLQKILECNLDGEFKRADIARKLGCSPSEITNLGKRMTRRLADFAVKHADKNPFRISSK